MPLKHKASKRNLQVQLFSVIRKEMYKGQNWMTEAVGSLHSALAKVGVVVEAGEVAATTLADSFSSHVCCSWTT